MPSGQDNSGRAGVSIRSHSAASTARRSRSRQQHTNLKEAMAPRPVAAPRPKPAPRPAGSAGPGMQARPVVAEVRALTRLF